MPVRTSAASAGEQRRYCLPSRCLACIFRPLVAQIQCATESSNHTTRCLAPMHPPRQLTAVLLLLLVSQSHVSALHSSNGGGGGPSPLRPIITGSLTFVHCRPASSSVRIAPAAGSSSVVAATGSFTTTNGDNNIVLRYSLQLATIASGAPALSGPYSINPSTPTLCLGAAWSPAVRAVTPAPARGQDLAYISGTPLSMDIPGLGPERLHQM